LGFVDFARPVKARVQLLDTLAVDVESNDREAGASEGNRYRKADVTETDYRDFAPLRHDTRLFVLVSD
jgi:hypothetical protein